jgi:hypothetical protein
MRKGKQRHVTQQILNKKKIEGLEYKPFQHSAQMTQNCQ